MKRSKPIPPASAEPWNTTTPDIDDTRVSAVHESVEEPIAPGVDDTDGPIDTEHPRPDFGPGDAPTVQMPAVAGDPVPLLHDPTHPAVDATAQPSRRRTTRNGAIAIGAVVAVIIAGAVGLVVALGGAGSDDPGPQAIAPDPATASQSAPASAAADPNADCPTATTGNVTTGRDAGNFTSGPGAIKAYDYAFYVTRSGADARAAGAPTANMGSPADLQASINKVPTGTRHCLRIVDNGGGLFDVTLTETPPGGGVPTIYQQRFQTTDIGGRTLIAQNLLNVRIG